MLTTAPRSAPPAPPRERFGRAHAGIPAPARPKRGGGRPQARPAPPLRVVTPEELREARRRVRARRAVAAAVVFVAVALFGVVVAHVLLMQGQFELEATQREAATQQAEYDRLRLQVAELESPERIVAAAQERLGMVSPPTITYLAPSADTMPATPAGDGDGGHRDTPARGTAAPPSSWSTVKPHLSEG